MVTLSLRLTSKAGKPELLRLNRGVMKEKALPVQRWQRLGKMARLAGGVAGGVCWLKALNNGPEVIVRA